MYVLKMYIKLNLFISIWMKRRRGLNVFGSPERQCAEKMYYSVD